METVLFPLSVDVIIIYVLRQPEEVQFYIKLPT